MLKLLRITHDTLQFTSLHLYFESFFHPSAPPFLYTLRPQKFPWIASLPRFHAFLFTVSGSVVPSTIPENPSNNCLAHNTVEIYFLLPLWLCCPLLGSWAYVIFTGLISTYHRPNHMMTDLMPREEKTAKPQGMSMFKSRKRSHDEGFVRVIRTLQSHKGLGERILRRRAWSVMSNEQEVEEAGDDDATRSGDLEVSGHLQEKHSSSRRKEMMRSERSGREEGAGSSYFLTWLPQHLTLTLPIYWITFPFFGSYEAHFTSPQIPSWAPCSLLTFKCQGFQGSVFSPCLCLMLKLSHSWWFQWCLPLGDPTLLSPALDSPQASDPSLAPPLAHGDSSGLQQAHLSGTQLTSHHQKSPLKTCFQIFSNCINLLKGTIQRLLNSFLLLF